MNLFFCKVNRSRRALNSFPKRRSSDLQLNIVTFYRQNLILSDTSYYGNEKTANLLDVWQKQTVNLLVMSGVQQDKAEQYAAGAVTLDQRLAQVYQSAEYNSEIKKLEYTRSVTEFESQSKYIHQIGRVTFRASIEISSSGIAL